MQELRDFNDSELTEALLKRDALSAAAVERARSASVRAQTTIEKTILELGLASEEAVFEALADLVGLPLFGADQFDPGLVSTFDVDRAFLERVEAVPFCTDKDGQVVIATSNPRAGDALQSLSYHLGVPCSAAIATKSSVKSAIAKAFDRSAPENIDGQGSQADIDRLTAMAHHGPTINQVNDLIAEAVKARASDIHIEPMEDLARVRLRVDGELKVHRQLSHSDCATFISRLKIMGRLNIAEKRRPQDGRAQLSVQGRNIDLRLATLPSQHGESIVVRVLDRAQIQLSWEALGYPPDRVSEIEDIINMPHGIFLVAGPTGSGKTTTLYTALEHINAESRKIITVEDPIEYAINGVTQVQVQPEIDMTFSKTLRAILRQDPNVVLVGEIRDEETAEIAVRAALLGRLVLSTIHTNDALSAIDRLIDLGIPPYLLGATLRAVLSQRLVRRRCQACQGEGCDQCGRSGLLGRRVISELMPVTAEGGREIAKLSQNSVLADDAKVKQFTPLSNSLEALISNGEIDARERAQLISI